MSKIFKLKEKFDLLKNEKYYLRSDSSLLKLYMREDDYCGVQVFNEMVMTQFLHSETEYKYIVRDLIPQMAFLIKKDVPKMSHSDSLRIVCEEMNGMLICKCISLILYFKHKGRYPKELHLGDPPPYPYGGGTFPEPPWEPIICKK